MHRVRFRKDLFRPPVAQSLSTQERRVTWLELFYDLVFVVAISQASTRLFNDFTVFGIAKTGLVFVTVWWAWVGQSFYLTRFDSDDLSHLFFTMVQMFFVSSMSLAIPTAMNEGMRLFLYSYAGVRAILVQEYLRAGYYIPAARPLTTRYAIGFSLAICVWILIPSVPHAWIVPLWILGIAIDYGTPFTAGSYNISIPPHVRHIPERLGLFTLITIGESVVSIVLGLQVGGLTPIAILSTFFGWMISFCAWYCYFIGIHGADPRRVDTPEASRNFRIWLYMHLPLAFGILVTAAGIKYTIASAGSGMPIGVQKGFILACGAALTMAAMNSISQTLPMRTCTPWLKKFIRPHYYLCGVTLGFGLLGGLIASSCFVAILALIWLGHFVLALRESPFAHLTDDGLDLEPNADLM